MFVIALALILIAAACAVVLIEASKSVIPLVGPAAHPAAPVLPLQRIASAALPVELNPQVHLSL